MKGKEISGARDSVVTGAGSGIGRAICERLAHEGMVGALDRNLAGAEETVELVEAAGGKAIPLRADVTDERSLEGAFDEFRRLGGVPEVVVAGAGVDTVGTVLDEDPGEWDRVMDINAKGVYLTARVAFPWFKELGRGSFLAIASDAGVLGARDFGIYCASKHAVVGLVKSLALDFGHLGLRSNAVCPGFVRTPMSEAHFAQAAPDEKEYYRSLVPLRRFAEPEEVAAVVAYLSSPVASYTNGSVYLLDGGASAALSKSA